MVGAGVNSEVDDTATGDWDTENVTAGEDGNELLN